jgi:hypothetical protein
MKPWMPVALMIGGVFLFIYLTSIVGTLIKG